MVVRVLKLIVGAGGLAEWSVAPVLRTGKRHERVKPACQMYWMVSCDIKGVE